LKTIKFYFTIKNALVCFNAGVVVVNAEAIGSADEHEI
jgi:hypothetical protein